MTTIEKVHSNDYCIYILFNNKTRKCQIYYATNPSGIKEQTEPNLKLVYVRWFDNMIDALGHKLLLEKISNSSLKRIIRMQKSKLEI